jgi:dipeptidyl aminopeptidase/acylaminoacyl peptidase
MKSAFLRALCAAAWLIAVTSASAQTRPVTPEDYLAFEAISDPHVSPDGTSIAFVKTTIDREKNRRHGTIWTVAVSGAAQPVQVATTPQSSSSPRWSPDGKSIAFLSSAGPPVEGRDAPRTQIWITRPGNGEPRRLTSLLNGVSAFQWSPDGKRLVCISHSGPSDTAKSASDVRHYKHLTYKSNDAGWFNDKRAHLWVVDAASGAAKQITDGEEWNDTDPQWSPDSRSIAFVSDRTGKAFDESRNTDVWVIDASGGPLTKVSTLEEPDSQPRWSPDGRTIAFVAATEERGHPKIWLAASSGGPARLAADNLDLMPTSLRWDSSGSALYFESGIKGTTHLFRVDLANRTAAQVTTGRRTIRSVDTSMPGRLVYLANDPTHLDDVYVSDASGDHEIQLTHANAALRPQLALASVEHVPFKGADGWDVDGFLMKPVGWEQGRKYPMVLSIHGGPAGMYGYDWFHEFQVYAGRGWAVFFTNPRGSTGYGEKFDRGVQLEWGGKAYEDIMLGVDAVLAGNPWIDRDRLGVTGGSYGGYMTNWIVSHTNRFKAAVTLRSISNFISDDGTRDGAYGHADDFGGDIFENHDLYWHYSPLRYAANVKTPTLILHSDNDFRVPIEQGEQWFRALRHFGVEAEIVFFPRENHNLTRTGEPNHLVESLKWQVYWFDRYLNGNAAAVPPDAPERKPSSY